jgi:hypothetical protein
VVEADLEGKNAKFQNQQIAVENLAWATKVLVV